MKILKPGKVEMRKFVCRNCGCVFAAHTGDAEFLTTKNSPYVFCPTCSFTQSWCDGEPYEELTQEDSRLKLIFLIKNFRACNLETADCEADFLIANGVTFREAPHADDRG